MIKNVYLVCQRNLIKVSVRRSFWTDFSPLYCFRSYDNAKEECNRLRIAAQKYGCDTVDYIVRSLFFED